MDPEPQNQSLEELLLAEDRGRRLWTEETLWLGDGPMG